MSFDHKQASVFTHRWKLRFWMLRHLPMGFISGMRISRLNDQECVVVLKDRWWIRNPFGSVFWAVMSMAAELSTGALLYAYAGRELKFILIKAEAHFFKKANGISYYFCQSGPELTRVIAALNTSGDKDVIRMTVVAKNTREEVIADFSFSWQLLKT